MGPTERNSRSRRESRSRTPPPRKRKSRWSRSRSRSKSRELRQSWRDCSPIQRSRESNARPQAIPGYRVPEEGELVVDGQSARRGPYSSRSFGHNQSHYSTNHHSSRRAPSTVRWSQPPANTGSIVTLAKPPFPPSVPKQMPPVPQGPPPDHHQASIPRPPSGTPPQFSGPPPASSGAVGSEFSQAQQPAEVRGCEDLKGNSRHGEDSTFQRPSAPKYWPGHNQYQEHRSYGRWNQRWDNYSRNRRYGNNSWDHNYHHGNNRYNSGYDSNRYQERGRQQRTDRDWFPNGRFHHARNKGYQHHLMPDRFGHNMHHGVHGRNRNEHPPSYSSNQYSGYISAARERFGNGYGRNWQPSWGPGRPPDNTIHDVKPEFNDGMKFDWKPEGCSDLSSAVHKQEEPASWLQWDCGSGNSWVDPYSRASSEVGQRPELRSEVLCSIVDRQRNIMDSGLRSLAARLGIDKGEGDGTMDASEKVAVVQKMLGIMCNENDTDYKCSDSEDEWGRRRKPYRITYRMRSRAIEELSVRAAYNAKWASSALERGIVIKPFPFVPSHDKMSRNTFYQEDTLPESNKDVVSISWDQPQDLSTSREDPRLSGGALGLPQETAVEERMELGIPSLAMNKFIRGFEKRSKFIQKLALTPNHQRQHIFQGTSREAINGVQKFNFINPKGALSSSGYTLKYVHNLTEKILAKGRKMVLPRSVAVRKEDNLWLQVREEPYSTSELEDHPQIGRPLPVPSRSASDSEARPTGQSSSSILQPSGQRVMLQLFWNSGWDREDKPVLVHIKVQYGNGLEGKQVTEWSSLRSLTAKSIVLDAVDAELRSRNGCRGQSGSNTLKRKADGEFVRSNLPPKFPKKSSVLEKSRESKYNGHDANGATNSCQVGVASEPMKFADESTLNMSGRLKSSDLTIMREKELIIETGRKLSSEDSSSLVYVRPGVQHVGRLAGLVGTQTIRRAEGYFASLMKSAADALKKDAKLHTEIMDARQHKQLQPQTTQVQQSPFKRKSQVLHTTPRKRRQGKLNAETPMSMSVVTSPSMHNTAGKGKGVLPIQTSGTEIVAGMEPASAGPIATGGMRGRGRGRGHRQGGLVRQAHSAPRPVKLQQGQTANGNHSQVDKQPRKASGFSNDGASVASWIMSCTFRSVTLEEQEAAKANTRKL